MKKEEFLNYESPSVYIIEVEVENGFVLSTNTGNSEGLEDGGIW